MSLVRTRTAAAQAVYDRNIFVALVSMGVILIAASLLSKTNLVLDTALSLAGVLSLIIASFRYWSSAYEWMKVLILAIALITLVTFALRKFKNEKVRP